MFFEKPTVSRTLSCSSKALLLTGIPSSPACALPALGSAEGHEQRSRSLTLRHMGTEFKGHLSYTAGLLAVKGQALLGFPSYPGVPSCEEKHRYLPILETTHLALPLEGARSSSEALPLNFSAQ